MSPETSLVRVMFPHSLDRSMVTMRVIIDIDRLEPLQGTISLGSAREATEDAVPTVAFGGWLSLVGRLYDVLGSVPSDGVETH